MSDTVFVLGAGASKQGGAPLMAEFLDVAADLLRQGHVDDSKEAFEAVFRGISELQQVHSKAQLDIQNVESVFSAFEMAQTLGRFADYTKQDLADLGNAMRSVIVKTIESTLRLPVHGTQGAPKVHPPPPYEDFAYLVSGIRRPRSRHQRSPAIITFNYDMGVDYGFSWSNIPIDYGLGSGEDHGGVPLLKLHGSLNWARCDRCPEIVAWRLHDYFQKYQWRFLEDAKLVTMQIGSHLESFEHCEQPVDPKPVLVPPTWSKTEHHRELRRVWSRAAEELAGAENIIVIGFSLPESDSFFSYLYALGTVGRVPLKRFWVFNPDQTGETEGRFRRLLGPGAEQRFHYFPETFEKAIGTLSEELGVAEDD